MSDRSNGMSLGHAGHVDDDDDEGALLRTSRLPDDASDDDENDHDNIRFVDSLAAGQHAAARRPPKQSCGRDLKGALTHRYAKIVIGAFIVTAVVVSIVSVMSHRPLASSAPPRNFVFMLSDGMGVAHNTLTRTYATYKKRGYQATNSTPMFEADEQLPLDTMLVGQAQTRSASQLITDSANGATVYSCGVKTHNGYVGVDYEQKPCGTIMEAARDQGKLIGVVVTSRVTHATPGAFTAHNADRNAEQEIALDQVALLPDVMFGGGRAMFESSTRSDGQDLLGAMANKGARVMTTRAEFDAFDPYDVHISSPVVALLADSHMAFEIDRETTDQPSLDEMVTKALRYLKRRTRSSAQGFMLLIEGSRIDMTAHNNDVGALPHETEMYQTTVQSVKDFIDANTDTLAISVSDHETGGLALGYQYTSAYPAYQWLVEPLLHQQASTEALAPVLLTETAAYRNDSARVETAVRSLVNTSLGVAAPVQSDVDEIVRAVQSGSASAVTGILGRPVARACGIGFTTHGHSACDINVYTYGKRASEFAGSHDAVDIGRMFQNMFSFDVATVTARLNQN